MREATNRIMELCDEQTLNERKTLIELLNWLSESDVKQFYIDYVRIELELD